MMRAGSFALTLALIATGAAAGAADTVAFVGPSGWSHVDPGASVQSDPTRKFDQWHLSGDVQTVTYIKDGNTSYADALAAIEKNFSDNHLKPSVDKDTTCQGRTGHVVEFATGPEGHRIVTNRMLVPDGSGIVTITYARAEGQSFDDDVKKSITTYCGS